MKNSEQQTNFTAQQADLLVNLVAQVNGSGESGELDYHIVGFADLREVKSAAAFIDLLLNQDWEAATARQQVAGMNDLLVGVLLRLRRDRSASLYWVALSAHLEVMSPSKIIAWGKVDRPPEASWIRLHKGAER